MEFKSYGLVAAALRGECWEPAALARGSYVPGRRVYIEGTRVSEGTLPPIPVAVAKPGWRTPLVVRGVRRTTFDRPNRPTLMARSLPLGRVLGTAPLYHDRKCPDTFDHGVRSRFTRPMPEPEPGELARFEATVDAWLAKNLQPLDTLPDFDAWIAHTPYTESRKAQLRQARSSFVDFPSLAECQRIAGFPKTEPYLKFKAERPINSRCDAFKTWFGPITHSVEQLVFRSNHSNGTPVFVKFIPVPLRRLAVMALRIVGFYYYNSDYTSFEASFSKRMMQATSFRLYRHMLKKFPQHWAFVEKVLGGKNKIKTSLCSITVEALRMSGEMDTSLANGFTNAMVFTHLIARGKLTGFFLVEGDDGILAVSRRLTREDLDVVYNLGFILKIEEVSDPCEASFCGMIFADQGVVKDPVRTFINFGWTTSFIHAGPKVMLSLSRAKALSLAYETGTCPLNWVLAQRVLKETRGVRVTHRTEGYNHVPSDEASCIAVLAEPTLATRMLYARKFNVSVEAQLRAEQYIRTCDIWAGMNLTSLGIEHLCDRAVLRGDHCTYG